MSTLTSAPTDTDHIFDVAIVGLGPVGACLANLLGLKGVSTLVLERETNAYHLPRAVHFDDEVMRVFQAIGLADEIEPTTRCNPGMRFVDAQGALLLDWPRPQGESPQGWQASYRFHQPDLERILRAGLARFPSVEVRTRCDVFAFTDDGASVEVRYEELGTGTPRTVRARYVVGCDGGRSLVRRFMGSSLEDLGFHERWLVLDVMLRRDKPELGDHTIQYCDSARPATYVRGPGDRRRWEITVHPHEDAATMTTPRKVWELLAPWLKPEEAELERAAVYTFHSAVARQWRAGRLLVAGDAAHLTPPFMGQGMCSGVRDAANLAWKLEAVVNGHAADALLDTYQSERAPDARAYIETAMRLGGLINTCNTEAALASAFRDEDGVARLKSRVPQLGAGLAAGRADRAGQRIPQPRLADGRRLDEAVGYGFALLARESLWRAASEGVRRGFTEAGIAVLTETDGPALAALLDEADASALLVRPDRYVAGAAHDVAELAALSQALAPYRPTHASAA
ncbi:bifunctional 3-(3-hydroxy-phenyl)propionate/3-hydroxycinnamic acid hydroxylase [Aquabacter sediminis]|uniref:bifunctional 3-(3-hydroxy-phenyl)propionate/3-hydroxycinnamic acid hydroxylase MhpA n=1 Tax=Aquabacter sediminis TaxID=3029197 RepID=UPI00237ED87B|nr:bifunctional 3-(3-hydroxy-phenyl)propionate/3-hydroxycinnamic acid hydroxylase [Aquabacter sp. P-9]MDE1568936.1 bifunctional 3-(3-hydroxy-phenyl)propionate/3-hydroxycinnamic acid hydroxylase [Aquabacter sp. P-9]